MAADKFKEISEAYEVLSDATKRAIYERGEDPFDTSAAAHGHGRGGRHGGGGMPADMFSSFFGGGGGGGGGFHFG